MHGALGHGVVLEGAIGRQREFAVAVDTAGPTSITVQQWAVVVVNLDRGFAIAGAGCVHRGAIGAVRATGRVVVLMQLVHTHLWLTFLQRSLVVVDDVATTRLVRVNVT